MSHREYATDLTDAEWEQLEPLIPAAKPGGRPRKYDMREILNAIFYLVRAGCAWRLLPHEFPCWKTVYDYFRNWRKQGVWEQIHTLLREKVRLRAGREATPSATIIDSQSVKTTDRGGPERGYDGGKKINGRKRHILVNITLRQSFLFSLSSSLGLCPEHMGSEDLRKVLFQPR
jgi:putative transposase